MRKLANLPETEKAAITGLVFGLGYSFADLINSGDWWHTACRCGLLVLALTLVLPLRLFVIKGIGVTGFWPKRDPDESTIPAAFWLDMALVIGLISLHHFGPLFFEHLIDS